MNPAKRPPSRHQLRQKEILYYDCLTPILSLAGHGIGGLYSGGIREGNGAGCFNVKLRSEAVADASQSGLGVDKGDEISV